MLSFANLKQVVLQLNIITILCIHHLRWFYRSHQLV